MVINWRWVSNGHRYWLRNVIAQKMTADKAAVKWNGLNHLPLEPKYKKHPEQAAIAINARKVKSSAIDIPLSKSCYIAITYL